MDETTLRYSDALLDVLVLEREARGGDPERKNELWRKIGALTDKERTLYFLLMELGTV